MRHIGAIAALAGLVGIASVAAAQPFRYQQVATGSFLWASSPPVDTGRLFLMTQGGTIRVLNLATGQLLTTPFLTVPGITASGEAGLLGLAFHPQYAANGYFYVYYTTPTVRTIARYHVSTTDADVADAASARIILQVGTTSAGIHQGGWLAFGPDGLLYNAWGNNAVAANGQVITNNLLGKVLRIDINGPDGVPGTADDDGFPADDSKNYRIPPGNPFVGITGDDEIWAYGLRNPFRGSFDRETGDFWIGDVGDNREEIDFAAAGTGTGKNYGYPCVDGNICGTSTGGCVCTNPAFTAPIYPYQRAGGSTAVIGGYVYRGCSLPTLRGRYIFTDYAQNRVWSFRQVSGAVTDFQVMTPTPPLTFVRSMGEDASGELYFCASSAVYKLVPVTPDCNANGLIDGCEITAGTAPDVNHNGVIDPCEHPWPCHEDYNQDGDIGTDRDIEDFFACLSGRCCAVCGSADFNGDGDVGTDQDIEAFFRVLAGGNC